MIRLLALSRCVFVTVTSEDSCICKRLSERQDPGHRSSLETSGSKEGGRHAAPIKGERAAVVERPGTSEFRFAVPTLYASQRPRPDQPAKHDWPDLMVKCEHGTPLHNCGNADSLSLLDSSLTTIRKCITRRSSASEYSLLGEGSLHGHPRLTFLTNKPSSSSSWTSYKPANVLCKTVGQQMFLYVSGG